MLESLSSRWKIAFAVAALMFATAAAPCINALPRHDHPNNNGAHPIRHVLLISIDGMHSVDFVNCSKGLSGVNGSLPYCPHLAALAETGVNFVNTSTSKPSDSFPGLMSIVTGATPGLMGVYYDVGYDRSLDPPAVTTGNGVAAGACTPGAPPTGSTAEYEEGVDIDQTQLNGGAPAGVDGGILSIDPGKLARDPAHNCAPVYPWNFVRANTIFGVIHAAGGYTAWSDKHPVYLSVSGPGNGTNVDDFYGPEINSIPANLPGVSGCDPLPDPGAAKPSDAWTDSFQNIQCYDGLKVQAVLNWINGKNHNGTKPAPTPELFGMNFQTVSVGQKLIEKSLGEKGGYVDSIGTPSPALLSEIEFTDASIGKMVEALKGRGLLNSTLIVISAKHGQSPIDSARYTGITDSGPVTTSPATILDNAGCLPASESPSNSTGIGPTEDDISLIWLNGNCSAEDAVQMLESQSPASNNIAGIGQILSGRVLFQTFGKPGLPPYGDPRTPDIIVTPNIGVTYSGSSKKQAEHGGFSQDDTNVMMLLSNPSFDSRTVSSYVETSQIAPTILQALGLDPDQLQAVRKQGTQVLPDVPLQGDNN